MQINLHVPEISSTFAPKIENTMYKDPTCYIADIENLTGVSTRTAQRIMRKVREYYGITGRVKPTINQVKEFLVQI